MNTSMSHLTGYEDLSASPLLKLRVDNLLLLMWETQSKSLVLRVVSPSRVFQGNLVDEFYLGRDQTVAEAAQREY